MLAGTPTTAAPTLAPQPHLTFPRHLPNSGSCDKASVCTASNHTGHFHVGGGGGGGKAGCSLGDELLPMPYAERYPLVCTAHRYRLANDVLCVPQKNGNQNWWALAYAFRRKAAPIAYASKDGAYVVSDCTAVGPRDRVLFVARNPYLRLLSFYLDKIQNEGREEVALALGISQWRLRWLSFDSFVAMLRRHVAATRQPPCAVDHHLCSQLSGCLFAHARSVRVLKLERQPAWFRCLSASLGLNASVRGAAATATRPEEAVSTAHSACLPASCLTPRTPTQHARRCSAARSGARSRTKTASTRRVARAMRAPTASGDDGGGGGDSPR